MAKLFKIAHFSQKVTNHPEAARPNIQPFVQPPGQICLIFCQSEPSAPRNLSRIALSPTAASGKG
jgi:hypothetical protein